MGTIKYGLTDCVNHERKKQKKADPVYDNKNLGNFSGVSEELVRSTQKGKIWGLPGILCQ